MLISDYRKIINNKITDQVAMMDEEIQDVILNNHAQKLMSFLPSNKEDFMEEFKHFCAEQSLVNMKHHKTYMFRDHSKLDQYDMMVVGLQAKKLIEKMADVRKND